MKIIDTHTHLYGQEFEQDLDDVVRRAKAEGVVQILLPNVDLESIPELFRSVQQHPSFMKPMMGLHPCSVTRNYQEQMLEIKSVYSKEAEGFYCAIGEVGLDYYWEQDLKKEQQDVFAEQVEWSVQERLPLSMHTREAVEDAIAIYKEAGAGRAEGVFHSFTGSEKELKRIEAETNAYVGINGVLTFKNSDLKSFLARCIPLDRLLVETDAPYLAPVPYRGKRNEPSFLIHVIRYLSDIYGASLENVSEQLFANSCKLFNLVPE